MPALGERVTRPAGLDEWEAHVLASDAPAVCMMDRNLVRALLRYVRDLEEQARLDPWDPGSFW